MTGGTPLRANCIKSERGIHEDVEKSKNHALVQRSISGKRHTNTAAQSEAVHGRAARLLTIDRNIIDIPESSSADRLLALAHGQSVTGIEKWPANGIHRMTGQRGLAHRVV